MKVIWVNRSEWKKPGPIVYIGLLNAHSFAAADPDCESHFFVSAGSALTKTEDDLRDFYGIEALPNLHIHRTQKGGKLVESFGRRVYRQALKYAKQQLAAGEQVIFLTRELGVTAMLARLQKRHPDQLRTVYEAHDFHADLSQRDQADYNDHRKRLTERLFLPRLSGVLCITAEQEALYCAALPGLNTITLPLGCRQFEAPPAEERRAHRTVAYIGHLHREKGVPGLLDHAAFFKQHDIRLQIIGGKREQTDKLLRKIKIGNHTIECLPAMPPIKLHQHFRDHVSLGIVPLQDTFYNRHLTCPVKALDSIAHHLPVIASDLPSTRGVIGDAGVYISPQEMSSEIVPAAIRDVLDDAERYQQLAAAASARAAELAWPTRARTIVEWTKST
jgi:glycosyltransferase involved in cell wall biosynthesis